MKRIKMMVLISLLFLSIIFGGLVVLARIAVVDLPVFFYKPYTKAQWSSVDPNCMNNDIVFTLSGRVYRWAGCNSTIDVSGYDLDYGGPIKDCAGNITGSEGGVLLTTTGVEIDIGGSCKINNIFGNMYQWDSNNHSTGGIGLRTECKASPNNDFDGIDNANCPCPDGRHVPSETERNIAMNYFSGDNGWNTSGGFVDILGLPLAGQYFTNWFARGEHGGYWASTDAEESTGASDAIRLYYSTGVNHVVWLKQARYASVRCVQDVVKISTVDDYKIKKK